MRFTLLAAAPLAAVLVWIGTLMVDPGIYSSVSLLLLGLGLILLTTIGTVGLVLVGGRWAHRLLVVMVAVTLILALARPLDTIGWIGLLASGAAFTCLYAPGADRLVRKLPSASGPPTRAVVVTLLGLSMPLALGLIPSPPNRVVATYALTVPLIAFAYSRTLRGGLIMIRAGVLLLTLALAFFMTIPHALASGAMAILITVIAFSKDVAIAFRPAVERGTTYAIPPELAPTEVLEEARIDESGRPK